MKHITSKTCNN